MENNILSEKLGSGKFFSGKMLSSPYIVWAAIFIIVPLGMVFYYGLTDKTGAFTLENIAAIMSAEHAKALWISLGLSLISTAICFFLAYPLAMILANMNVSQHSFIVLIFILPMWMNFLHTSMADFAGKNRCYQQYPFFPPSTCPEYYQYPLCHRPWHGV